MKAKITRELLRDIKPQPKTFDILDTEQRGFLARVTPSGSINYGIRYSNSKGRQCRYSLGKDFPATLPSAAREEARILLGKVAAGADPAEEERVQRQRVMTLGHFIDEQYAGWLIANTKTGKKRSGGLKSGFSNLIDKPLVEINAWLIEKWRAERTKAGNSPSTTNRLITALRGLFSKALEWKLISEHPLSSVKMLQEPSAKARWLSDDEERRLRAALDAREQRERKGRENANIWRIERNYEPFPVLSASAYIDHLKPMVILSLNTGIRQGELFKLRWDALNLNTANLTIHDVNSKSGRTRHIPLNSEALDMLTLWQQQTTGNLVFPGHNGTPMTTVKTAWGNLLKEARIENFRWHDMRHHFASRLVMVGVDLNTVRALLGHSDLKMTLRYAHLAPEHTAIAVEKLMRKL